LKAKFNIHKTQEAEERISRRELLKGLWARRELIPVIDKEKCTGCGLCALRCQEKALTVVLSDEEDSYRIIFERDLCTACGLCETSCPEKCLTLVKAPEEGDKDGRLIVFEDEMTRCSECGVLLFPQAMVRRLKEKTRAAGELDIPFDLCPACRIKRQISRSVIA
jgi:ferredoxin